MFASVKMEKIEEGREEIKIPKWIEVILELKKEVENEKRKRK